MASLVPAQTIAQGIQRIKETFPEDPVTACAIAFGESFPNNGINNNPKTGDFSVGWFQINLFNPARETKSFDNSLTNPVKKIHWDKAQGKTLGEKVAWLQIPENNLKVARIIFEGSNPKNASFNPWGAYRNSSFNRHIERCKQ